MSGFQKAIVRTWHNAYHAYVCSHGALDWRTDLRTLRLTFWYGHRVVKGGRTSIFQSMTACVAGWEGWGERREIGPEHLHYGAERSMVVRRWRNCDSEAGPAKRAHFELELQRRCSPLLQYYFCLAMTHATVGAHLQLSEALRVRGSPHPTPQLAC